MFITKIELVSFTPETKQSVHPETSQCLSAWTQAPASVFPLTLYWGGTDHREGMTEDVFA